MNHFDAALVVSQIDTSPSPKDIGVLMAISFLAIIAGITTEKVWLIAIGFAGITSATGWIIVTASPFGA